ncbi:hypothetical protein NDU88_006127 [Pleurodeles waltl]|uniref:Uncharacterized protein n=1 Tax=Pleurodeles waltl TaxID=8319 RepID=A0AAV7WEN5_PLEWA|nr:hypothetical protein NDU88_006127 [Pleurodeles waltl]
MVSCRCHGLRAMERDHREGGMREGWQLAEREIKSEGVDDEVVVCLVNKQLDGALNEQEWRNACEKDQDIKSIMRGVVVGCSQWNPEEDLGKRCVGSCRWSRAVVMGSVQWNETIGKVECGRVGSWRREVGSGGTGEGAVVRIYLEIKRFTSFP